MEEGSPLHGCAAKAEAELVYRIIEALGLFAVWLQDGHLHIVGQGKVRYADSDVPELLLGRILHDSCSSWQAVSYIGSAHKMEKAPRKERLCWKHNFLLLMIYESDC